jgi:hypothetical protein
LLIGVKVITCQLAKPKHISIMQKRSLFFIIIIFVFLLLLFSKNRKQSENSNLQVSDSFKKNCVSEYIPGTDITDQLRKDLNASLDVNLPEGHFYTSESITIYGYTGTIKGAGKDVTIIEASTNFKASKDTMFDPEYELTGMFTAYWSKGDVTFQDFTILVTGNAPAELHNNPFHGMSSAMDNAIAVVGIHKDAEKGINLTFGNLKIQGEDSDDAKSVNGKNLAYPLIASGAYGAPLPLNVVIQNCEIESSGFFAIEFHDLYGGTGILKNNSFRNCTSGFGVAKFRDPLTVLGKLYVMENTFENIKNHAIGNFSVWLKYCFKNNTLDGEPIPDDCK